MKRKDPYGRVLRKHEYYRSKEGRYMFRIKTTFGKTIDFYSPTLQGLRDKVDKHFKSFYAGIDIAPVHSVSLNQLFSEYISFKTELKESTVENYRYMWSHFVEDTIGKLKAKDITYSDLYAFYSYLLKEKKLQVNTLANIHTLIHPSLDLAVRNNIISHNVSDGVFRDFAKKYNFTKTKKSRLSIREQALFMDYLNSPTTNTSWRIIFTTMLHTGCRVGEITSLRWSDVDFDKRIISINHSVRYMKNKDNNTFGFNISTPKSNAGKRLIPMTNMVYEILSLELDRQRKSGGCKTIIGDYTDFIFTNKTGNIHNTTTLNRALKRIIKSYNDAEIVAARLENREPILLPRISCHTLRHTFASRICENNNNLKFIQTVMGHADVATTMNIYAEFSQEASQCHMNALDSNSIFNPTLKIAI